MKKLKFFFANNLELDNYYIEDQKGDESIVVIREDGREGNWLIDDEIFRKQCLAYLKQGGVKIVKSC